MREALEEAVAAYVGAAHEEDEETRARLLNRRAAMGFPRLDGPRLVVRVATPPEWRCVRILPRGLPGVTFEEFIRILKANRFILHRQGKGPPAIYRGAVDGQIRLVTVAAHRMSDDIKPGALAAMIRQSGLPKRLFR